jgi:hypothetical protein
MKNGNIENEPRYKVGDVVSAVSMINRVENGIIESVSRSTGSYKGWIYKIDGDTYAEYDIYTDRKMFVAKSAITELFSANSLYANCITDIMSMCEDKTNALFTLTQDDWEKVSDDESRLEIKDCAMSLFMYTDSTGDRMERQTFTELLICREDCGDGYIYIDWFLKVNGGWVSVYENFEDMVYIKIADILNKVIGKWITDRM